MRAPRRQREGGSGSGNFGHGGVPGQVGGSAPGSGPKEVALPSGAKVSFIPSPRADLSGDVSVPVDVSKFDGAWKKDVDYLSPSEGMGDRRERFQDFLQTGKPIHMPEVAFDVDQKRVIFVNGRHRYAVLRDQGIKTMWVSVPKGQASEVKKELS